MQKKVLKKIEKCPRYPKQWVLRCLPGKKEDREKKKKKIARTLQQKFLSSKQERHVLRSIVVRS
jgi:hypothetical protein